jgi:hypothetical protein
MTTQFLGVEATETLRADNPAYRLREVDQTAPAGMWSMGAQGADMLFQAASAADWSAFTDVVTLASTPAVTIHGTLTVSGTIVFEDNVRLDDDTVVLFGDSSDLYMGYSATDDALEIGTGATIASDVALAIDSSGGITLHGTPTISDLSNATHGHTAAASGGTLTIYSNQVFIPAPAWKEGTATYGLVYQYTTMNYEDSADESANVGGFFEAAPTTVQVLVVTNANGNFAYYTSTYFAASGQIGDTHTDSEGSGASPLTAACTNNFLNPIDITASFTSASAGDFFGLKFHRDAASALDTCTGLAYVIGLLITY